jgi:hypothetical protein
VSPLRVVTPPLIAPSPAILSPKVHFDPSPSEKMQPTYHNSTGIEGALHLFTQSTTPWQPLSTSATPYPRQTTQQTSVPVSIHRYDTRSKSKASAPIATFTRDTDTPAYALLGNTTNLDIGTIAKCKELSQYSEGPRWQASNAEEIGCLTQVFGEQQGTNTMFFIPHTSIAKNKRSTYLQLISAYQPEKANPQHIC